MNTQEKFRFAQTHEWADPEDDGLVWVGISNHAQEALGVKRLSWKINWLYFSNASILSSRAMGNPKADYP